MTSSAVPHRAARRAKVTIHIGGVYASADPTVVKTLLGSCVAVCLWDAERRVGGMNHFLLPHAPSPAAEDAARFGIHAMDLLIGALLKAGANRSRLRAKMFGGAHVLAIRELADGVPQQNIRFARAFLVDEGFPLVSEDVGGYEARRVHFQTDTGRAFVQRIRATAGMARRVLADERRRAIETPSYGDVMLF